MMRAPLRRLPRPVRGALLSGVLAVAAALLPVQAAGAQSRGGDGYLFRAPAAALTVRAGVAHPSAAGGLFDFVREELTLGPASLTGVNLGAEFSLMATPRFALQLGAAWLARTAGSEYRDFVGTDDLPIAQQTTFQRTPLWAGVQWNLLPVGERVGRLAWVPNRFVPYLSAGGGMMHFRFRQVGEFVDAESLDIFESTLTTGGWAPLGYVAAGTTLALSPGVGLTVEVRRDQARGTAAGSFRDFRRIDLSGSSATVGLTFRY